MANFIGWSLIACSFYSWVSYVGIEFGLMLGLLVLPVLIWSVLWLRVYLIDKPVSTTENVGPLNLSLPTPSKRGLLSFALVFLLALAVTVSTTLWVSSFISWPHVGRISFIILLAPIVWGCLAVWLFATEKYWTAMASCLSAVIVSSFFMFLV